MTNNDILRRLRYSFAIDDSKMITLFRLGGDSVTREQISNWLKKDDDPAFVSCRDRQLAVFLNGLITDKRGQREGPKAEAENQLTNNIVFRKLRIALNLHEEDLLALFDSVQFRISKHELSAFFRKPQHKNYRACKDQVLRNFLQAIQEKYRT